MRVTGTDHTSYTVSNLDLSLEFYVDFLGCELLWKRDIASQYFRDIVGFPDCVVRGAYLRIPGSDHKLELFEYVQPRGITADMRTNNPGSSHIAFYVDDLDAAYAQLRAKGVRFRSPPVYVDSGTSHGGYALYMLDPDGITVELYQPPKPE